MFAGGGTLGFALSRGMASVISSSRVSGACELEGAYVRRWSALNPTADTFGGDVSRFHPAELTPANCRDLVFAAGIPCTGASAAGRAKNKLRRAEDHGKAGTLFIPTLLWVRLHRPKIVIFENVPAYGSTASARIIRQTLKVSGYYLFETVLDSYTQFNTPTQRRRWVMVATLDKPFVWNIPSHKFSGTLEPFLDPESADDVAMPHERVAAHAAYMARKASEGCRWTTRVVDKNSALCPTIVRTYHKVQAVGPFLRCGETYRQLRPREIARLHGFPDEFELPCVKKRAIEILGQGVCYQPFFSLGQAVAHHATVGQSGQMSLGLVA